MIEQLIKEVREFGTVNVGDKEFADEIIREAKLIGFNFGYKKFGWGHLVVNND